MKTVKMLNGETKYFEEVNGELVEVEKKGRFVPKEGERYYYVNSRNLICCNTNKQLDEDMIIKHNV